MVAIVRRAVYDFALYRDLPEDDPMYEHAVDAAGWLFWDGEEEVDDDGRMTFRYICEIIGVEPAHIRHRALKLNREDIRRLNTSSKGE